MICKSRQHIYQYLVTVLVLLQILFIVICMTGNGNESQIIDKTLSSNVSTNYGRLLHRTPRSVRRGQNNYFQRSYEMNRLRHELQSMRTPRLKPFFHNVNEVYTYYLPPKFTKINKNVENFSDKLKDNRFFGTKTRSMTRSKGEHRFTLTRRVLPSTDPFEPIRVQTDGPKRIGKPVTSSQYQTDRQTYRPDYQRLSTPRIPDREQPSSIYEISSTRSPVLDADPTSLVPESQNLVKNSTFAGIPGWQQVDFPGYATVPYTGFRCKSQPYYGYYADVAASCQVFHVCQPDGREYSFLCPNGTVYHQKVQTCDWWWHVDCASSPRFYYLNARIGVLPPVDATLYRFPKTS